MIIIPAIDIKAGKCVRLLQGKMDKEIVYSDKPEDMAKKWSDAGAKVLHVVDLDGATSKKPENLDTVKKIVNSVDIPLRLGGGIRNMKTADMLFDIGIDKIVIGTEAVRNPDFVEKACAKYPEKIIVGIDAKDGMASIEGWEETTSVSAVDLAKKFENCGVAAINFTDIARDGMQRGVNIEATRIIAESVSIPIIASGGVSGIEDIKKLLEIRVAGVITGKALYTGALDLKEAIKIVENNS